MPVSSTKGSTVWALIISAGFGVVWAFVWKETDPLSFWLQPIFALTVGFVFLRMTAASSEQHEMRIGNGVLAALIVAGTVLGPYLWKNPVVLSLPSEQLSADLQREDALVALAMDVAIDKVNAGLPLQWPPGITMEYASKKTDFPAPVWQEAILRWEKMSMAEQDKFFKLRNKLSEQIDPPKMVAVGSGIGGQLAWLLVSMACAFVPACRVFVWS